MMMPHDMGGAAAANSAPGAVARRHIFLRIDSDHQTAGPESLFAINGGRTPLFYVDVDIHILVELEIKDLGPGTGWGRVPTPMF